MHHRAKETGTPSNRKRSCRPVPFTDAKKQELITFVTRDRRARRLSWEEITAEMAVYGIPQAPTPEKVQRAAREQTLSSPMGPGTPLMNL